MPGGLNMMGNDLPTDNKSGVKRVFLISKDLYFSFNRAAAFLKTASLRKRTGGSLFYFNLFHHLLLVFFKYRICYPFQWTHVHSPWPFNFQGNGSGGSLMPHFRRTGFFPVVRTGFQPAWEQSEFHQSGKRFHCHFKNDRVHQLE